MIKKTVLALTGLSLAAALCACGGGTEVSPLSSADEASLDSTLYFSSAEASYPFLDTSTVTVDENGVYSVAGFSVKLPSGYVRQHVDDLALYASDNERASVVLSVEALYNMTAAGLDVEMSVTDYAKLVVKTDETIQTPVYQRGDGAYFEYVKDIGDKQYRYFAYAYKGSEAFYLLQLCCAEEDTEQQRPSFETIAESVVVS